MDCLKIIGGQRLHGSVHVSGSKNASLPIFAACILAEEPVRLWGVPRLTDVATQIRVLEQLGVRVERLADQSLAVETVDVTRCRADHALVSRMRASFCVLGPLLARRGSAVVALPGGCKIGPRPVDLHLKALEALGASITISHGYVVATARRLRGTRISMLGPHGPSVTGTANALCAATTAKGVTVIQNAAHEPEIEDLGHFLTALGARIEGLGTSTLVIEGQPGLGGAAHRVIPDRIEAATLLLAVATAGGDATIKSVQPAHLESVLGALEQVGAHLHIAGNSIRIRMNDRPRPANITALPYPGIPTDLQAQWMALLCLATGRSTIRDAVFPERNMHADELRRLGAKIAYDHGTATIEGVPRLSGAPTTATDLRAGAALVLAGLAAHGQTTVGGLEHLRRGYAALDRKLRQLGAQIRLINRTAALTTGTPAG